MEPLGAASVGSCQAGRRMGLDVKTLEEPLPPAQQAGLQHWRMGRQPGSRRGEREGQWGRGDGAHWVSLHQPPAWSPQSQARLKVLK